MEPEVGPDEQPSSGWVSVGDSGANTPREAQEIDFVTLGMFILGMLSLTCFLSAWLGLASLRFAFRAMSLLSQCLTHKTLSIHMLICLLASFPSACFFNFPYFNLLHLTEMLNECAN